MMCVPRCLLLVLDQILFLYHGLQKRRGAFLLMPFLFTVSPSVLSDYHFSACDGKYQAVDIVLQRIENEWPMRGSGDRVSRYVQKLGVRLAHFSAYGQNISWQFSVVRNLAPNAFSIGGGYVFITDGAINFVQNESELAAILAHELGHELAGHFCNTSGPSDSGGFFDVFSAPGTQQYQVGVGSMTQIIDPVKEQQADQIALSILQAGGFDPRAMLDVARRLHPGKTDHFSDGMRIQALEQAVANMPPVSTGSSEEFLNIKRVLAAE